MKIACAQIKPHQAEVEKNTEKIIDFAKRAADAGAEVVVFPELVVPGYLALDNFELPYFLQRNIEAIEEIAQRTKDLASVIIVGYALNSDNGRPYNAAAVISKGSLVANVKKTLLPEYDIFWESRYFKSSQERDIVEVNGSKLAIQICEDLWDEAYEIKVTDELAAKNPDVIINLSASPFHAEKISERFDLITSTAKREGIPFVYVNTVGVLDGYQGEVVFDGRSIAANSNGEIIALGKGFEEDLLIVDLDTAKPVSVPEFRPEEEIYDALRMGIRDYLTRNGFSRVYIALSGGIDSAVVCALAADALGPEAVTTVTMPSHITSDETLSDAKLLAKNLSLRCDTREIGSLYQTWLKGSSEVHQELNSITKQNIQARLRGAIMMEYTNQDSGAIVLSTGNKTELALGYCTLYGDMCGGLAVIGDVSKEMVYRLARFINEKAGSEVIPQTTIDRVPSAELEEGQSDKDNLPADYDILSPLVDLFIEDRMPFADAVSWLIEQGVADAEGIAERTVWLIKINEYKRRQMAPSIRVSPKAFGSGRRFPVAKPSS